MHYVDYGSGTPILIIHGFCVDHRLLLELDPVFDAHGHWRRVYVDLPGMGQSTAGPEIDSADAVAEAVVSFARTTFADERFAVLGNSFGGMIARHLVAEFGEQVLGLALLCPVVVADHGSRTVPARTVLQTDPTLLAALDPVDAADYEAMAVVQSPENWCRFRDAALPGFRVFDQSAVQRISSNYALRAEPEDRFANFQGPALILAGRQDHVVGYEDQLALAGSYPQATVAVLDRAGHNAHLDQPALTAALLGEWLERVQEWKREDQRAQTNRVH
ncbi:alpha/beta fold hydrolase [Arthrobacter sp. ISL-95]|uniref:alpha/beta fold hydrolase n=1 Tax=Arthrobacter sp. ISL-95 TaxID=2819116 RepID=UPI001BEA5460|nr:alpha/beta hydrolase [Arthrobacter sp. ISL-95]MBT2587071.1 alpha/beta hydrolase [Arthrobacter sp. ISL-95]